MCHREQLFKNVQKNRGKHGYVSCFDTEIPSQHGKTNQQKQQVDKKVNLGSSKRKKPADDNGHTGYTAERKIVGEFKNINSNIHDQNSCGNNNIFF